MSIVSISKCIDYSYEEVISTVKECLDRLPEVNQIEKGSRVLVKTNLLKKNKPEDAVTTHPFVVEGVVRYLQDMGCDVIVGDSPGGPFTEKILRNIYNSTGITGVQERTGCNLNFDISSKEVFNNDAKVLKNMKIVKVFDEVDYVISCAKLKTHVMMTYTGAVKNLFGVIPGVTKAEYHFKMNDVDHFANILIDICEYVKPVISIIDAIDCMEGDGPSSGEIRNIGLIMASKNPYLLDYISTQITGINPVSVPTIMHSVERGLFSTEEFIIKGVQVEEINIEPFKLPHSTKVNFVGGRVPKFVEGFIMKNLRPIPVISYQDCISCGICANNCPAKIIKMTNNKPVISTNKCIRCFCCHELCPKKAISVKKHPIHKVIFGTK